jgi:hypothetical protein
MQSKIIILYIIPKFIRVFAVQHLPFLAFFVGQNEPHFLKRDQTRRVTIVKLLHKKLNTQSGSIKGLFMNYETQRGGWEGVCLGITSGHKS